MNALVWLGPREMAWRELPRPELAAGEIRVKVQAVGICGSELSGYLGHNSLRVPPLVMGHEFSGVVEEVGVPSGAGFAVGDRVVVNPLLTCGACEYCVGGYENLCQQRALIGAHLPGAFADSVVVPASACVPLPGRLDYLTGSLAEPLACAVRAVSLAAAGDRPRRSLRVIGAGPIGLLCALVARQSGFEDVTIFDPNESRMALASAWGIASSGEAAGQAVGHAGSADAAIDAVGLEATRQAAIGALRRGGTAVFVGLHSPQAAFDGNDLVRDEKAVRGCFGYTRGDFARALTLLEDGLVPPAVEWVTVRDLADGRACFEELTGLDPTETRPTSVKIVLRPSGADWRLEA